MSEYDFQPEVLSHLGELRGEVKSINARLDRLNGTVARHEQAIHEVRLDLATHEATQSSAMNSSATWAKAIWVVLSALAGGGVVTMVQAAMK